MSGDRSKNNDKLPPWLRDVPLPPRPPSAGGQPPASDASAQDWMSNLRGSITPPEPELQSEPQGDMPDWLADMASSAAPATPEPEALPDWLRESGGQAASSAPSADDVPDWLRESSAPAAPRQPAAESIPEWLRESVGPALTDDTPADDVPDWLREANETPAAPTAPSEQAWSPAPVQPSADMPDWLSDVSDQTPSAGVPNWLAADQDTADDEDAPVSGPATGQAAAPQAPTGDVPDWLSDVSMDNVRAAMEEDDVEPLTASPFSLEGIDEKTPPSRPQAGDGPPRWFGDDERSDSWLDSVAEQPAEPEQELSDADAPLWLRDVAPERPAEPVVRPPADDTPDWLTPAGPTAPAATPGGDVPAWLRAEANQTQEDDAPEWLRPSQPAADAPPVAPQADDVPDWLRAAQPSSESPGAAPAEDIPNWLQAAQPSSDVPSSAPPADQVPDWLRAAEHGRAEPPVQDEGLPSWLRSGAEPPSGAPTEDVPDWLQSPPAESPPAQPAAPSVGDDLPPWLRDDAGAPLPTAGTPGDAALPSWLQGATVEPPSEPPAATPLEEQDTEPFGGWFDQQPAAPAETPGNWFDDQPVRPADTPEAESGFLGGTDLPAWLRGPSAEGQSAAQAAPTSGRTLDWLTRLGSPDEEETTVAAPTGPRLALPQAPVRSAAHLSAVSLLEQLAAEPYPDAVPLPAKPQPSLWRRIGIERVLYLALLVVLLAALAVPSLAAQLQSPPVVASAQPLFTRIDSLTEQDVVLLGYDWDARRISELRPLEQAVVDQLIEKRVKMVLISTDPQGTLLLYDLADRLRTAGYRGGGQDYILLGYKPGGELALRSLTQNLDTYLASDFQGLDARDSGLASGLTTGTPLASISDFAMTFVLADDAVDVQGWMEQVYSQIPDKPMAFLLPAEAEPIIQPYLREQGIEHLSGKAGALAYQALRGTAANSQIALESGQYRLGLLVFAALFVLGAIVSALAALGRRRNT